MSTGCGGANGDANRVHALGDLITGTLPSSSSTHILKPRFLSSTAACDVASNICQALPGLESTARRCACGARPRPAPPRPAPAPEAAPSTLLVAAETLAPPQMFRDNYTLSTVTTTHWRTTARTAPLPHCSTAAPHCRNNWHLPSRPRKQAVVSRVRRVENQRRMIGE